MSIWLNGYEKVVGSTNKTGDTPRHPDSPSRIVLHTTEGLRLYDYPWPPHFTLALTGDPHSLPVGNYTLPGHTFTYKEGDEVRHQHCDLALSSYALLHRSSDPETNHEGAHCVQVEIVSMAASPPHWSDAFYKLVASWLANVVTALPDLLPALDNYPLQWSERGSWGFDTPYRMSWKSWQEGINGKTGVPFLCGHQHVPGNDHWDPGALDIAKLTRLAKELLNPPIPIPTLEERIVKLEDLHLQQRTRISLLTKRVKVLENL